MITLHCSEWNTHELCKMEGCTYRCHKSMKMVFFVGFFCCGYSEFCYDPLARTIEHWQTKHPLLYLDFVTKCSAMVAEGKLR